jgi:DNA replication and repair protein RecF
MFLAKLALVNFKNYGEIELQFSSKINCFIGNNGVGKTNLLDAIHYLSMCKSYFNAIDSQNIRYNDDFFVVQGEFAVDGLQENILCAAKRNTRKQFKKNGKEYQKFSEHIGLLPLVMISPADSSLILDGSEERRRFINSVISQYDRQYLEDTILYNRALANRNQLLKNFAKTNTFDKDSLEIWDMQLIAIGQRIFTKRESFICKLMPVFQKYYDFVSEGKEKVDLIYQSDLQGEDYASLLQSSLNKDRILQYTSTGIHKDDLLLNINGYPIKKAGSQGQQKTFLVALKLAEFDFISDIKGFKPILLLDDIFDKFDKQRVKQVLRLVADDNFGQIFITDTNEDNLKEILKDIAIEHKLFKIDNNTAIENQ